MEDPSTSTSSSSSSCPYCEREIPTANFDLHTVHCQRNLERCRICGEMVVKGRAFEHFEENHAPMRCVLCDGTIERELLVLHQTEECLQRLLACSYCEFPLAAVDWDAHVNHCGNRTEMCIPCGKYVRLRERTVHDLQHHNSNQREGVSSSSIRNSPPANEGSGSSTHRLWITVAITGIAILIGAFVFQRREPIENPNKT